MYTDPVQRATAVEPFPPPSPQPAPAALVEADSDADADALQLPKAALALSALAALAACGGGEIGEADAPASVLERPQAAAVPQAVYRFAKLSNGAYFYTGSTQEKDLILQGNPDMRYEGVGFYQQASADAVPVYRFANLLNGGYFYTASAFERDLVQQTRPDMRFEGSSFSVAGAAVAGTQPVYRLANLNNGAYLYTSSAVERDAALALGYWRDEGVAFYTGDGSAVPELPMSDPDAARFLLQAQFSASDAEIGLLRNDGFAAWLERQMNAPRMTSGWDWLMAKGYNTDAQVNNIAPADYMVWNQLIAAPDAVRQRVALALSEIFVVSSNGMEVASRAFAMAAWWDTLAGNAFGNFRTLLEAVTLNPAMGVYLNTRGNQKENAATGRQPDENYGREVLQLFTIGLYQLNPDGSNKLNGSGQPVESYDQATVTNLARVFTGWNLDTTGTSVANPLQVRTPMKLNNALHSTLASSFFGATVPANTNGTAALKIALDAIFQHPNVGPFIGRQLVQRMVTSNPSNAYVGRVAAAFNDNGAGVRGDLKATLRAVLLDPEARAPASGPNGGKLREPVLRFVQWARTFRAVSSSGDWKIGDLTSDASRLGQSPLRSASVFNFFRPGYVPPDTAVAQAGLVAPEFQITNETTVAGYLNFMQTTIRAGFADVLPEYSAELALVGSPADLVNRLNLLLCAGQLSDATQATIRNAIGTIAVTTPQGKLNRVQAAILLVMGCPQYLVQK